jgi:hypothetical protein
MLRKISLSTLTFISALAIICGGITLAWIMYGGASKLPLRQYFPRNQVNAVWDWSNPLNKTQTDLDRISNFMYLHQLNTVYVDGGQYLSIEHSKASDNQKKEQQQALDKAISRYIGTLKGRNIRVFLSGGDTTWSNHDQWNNPQDLLKAAKTYNANHATTPLAGVEFDIEAYNQTGFADGSITAKTLVLTDYLDMVNMLAKNVSAYNKTASHQLEVGFAIPYWFDNENGNIPSVTWHEQTGPVLYHLLDCLNQLPKSNVVVMAYSNASSANDGTINHSRTEVEYVQAKAPHVKVLIGQEVNDVEPIKITFYGQSSTVLSSQVRFVSDEFQSTSAYGGIAINDLAGFEKMESTTH